MPIVLNAILVTILTSGSTRSTYGANDALKAIVDKAIQALGGEAKLRAVDAIKWKAKGKSFADGNETEFTNETTIQGLDRLRTEYEEGETQGVTVINRDKAWRKYGQ